MERSPFESLFGNNATIAEVVDETPSVQEIPFKIPMKIIKHVTNNRYEGDEIVHPGEHLLFYMNYANCLSVQVLQWKKLRINYSLYRCLEELHIYTTIKQSNIIYAKPTRKPYTGQP